jgi:DNA-binding NarL/FixJ family response regulator
LLLAPVGDPRPGLLAFLQSIPELELLDQAGEIRLDLVIVDVHLPAYGDWAWLRQAKVDCAAARSLVIVSTLQQMADAKAAGSDGVLLSGFTTAQFLDVLHELECQDDIQG